MGYVGVKLLVEPAVVCVVNAGQLYRQLLGRGGDSHQTCGRVEHGFVFRILSHREELRVTVVFGHASKGSNGTSRMLWKESLAGAVAHESALSLKCMLIERCRIM